VYAHCSRKLELQQQGIGTTVNSISSDNALSSQHSNHDNDSNNNSSSNSSNSDGANGNKRPSRGGTPPWYREREAQLLAEISSWKDRCAAVEASAKSDALLLSSNPAKPAATSNNSDSTAMAAQVVVVVPVEQQPLPQRLPAVETGAWWTNWFLAPTKNSATNTNATPVAPPSSPTSVSGGESPSSSSVLPSSTTVETSNVAPEVQSDAPERGDTPPEEHVERSERTASSSAGSSLTGTSLASLRASLIAAVDEHCAVAQAAAAHLQAVELSPVVTAVGAAQAALQQGWNNSSNSGSGSDSDRGSSIDDRSGRDSSVAVLSAASDGYASDQDDYYLDTVTAVAAATVAVAAAVKHDDKSAQFDTNNGNDSPADTARLSGYSDVYPPATTTATAAATAAEAAALAAAAAAAAVKQQPERAAAERASHSTLRSTDVKRGNADVSDVTLVPETAAKVTANSNDAVCNRHGLKGCVLCTLRQQDARPMQQQQQQQPAAVLKAYAPLTSAYVDTYVDSVPQQASSYTSSNSNGGNSTAAHSMLYQPQAAVTVAAGQSCQRHQLRDCMLCGMPVTTAAQPSVTANTTAVNSGSTYPAAIATTAAAAVCERHRLQSCFLCSRKPSLRAPASLPTVTAPLSALNSSSAYASASSSTLSYNGGSSSNDAAAATAWRVPQSNLQQLQQQQQQQQQQQYYANSNSSRRNSGSQFGHEPATSPAGSAFSVYGGESPTAYARETEDSYKSDSYVSGSYGAEQRYNGHSADVSAAVLYGAATAVNSNSSSSSGSATNGFASGITYLDPSDSGNGIGSNGYGASPQRQHTMNNSHSSSAAAAANVAKRHGGGSVLAKVKPARAQAATGTVGSRHTTHTTTGQTGSLN
jgi:hypothetical protein